MKGLITAHTPAWLRPVVLLAYHPVVLAAAVAVVAATTLFPPRFTPSIPAPVRPTPHHRAPQPPSPPHHPSPPRHPAPPRHPRPAPVRLDLSGGTASATRSVSGLVAGDWLDLTAELRLDGPAPRPRRLAMAVHATGSPLLAGRTDQALTLAVDACPTPWSLEEPVRPHCASSARQLVDAAPLGVLSDPGVEVLWPGPPRRAHLRLRLRLPEGAGPAAMGQRVTVTLRFRATG